MIESLILIVDDHAAFRRLVQSLFPRDTQFIECSDGESAVKAYGGQRPDWVLMDVAMRGIDGLKATRQIKGSHPDARVVILTQYDDPDLRAHAREVGACAYILKENISDLRHLINGAPVATV